MSQDFCCDQLQVLIESPDCPLRYLPHKREYLLTIPTYYLKKNEVCMSFRVQYCPWCGSRFPQNLSDEWWNIIEEQFNITGMFDPKIKKLPEEFLSDTWWKKRGL